MPSITFAGKFSRWGGWWPERLASIAAMTGLVISILEAFHPGFWPDSATDFKTVYASSWNLARGIDGYSFHNIALVFDRFQVTPPVRWYAHAPVYPPFTLAVLSLLTVLPMVPAVYAFMALSASAMAGAATVLTRSAWDSFRLNRVWRFVLIGLVAAAPLVGFGLQVGNVSVLAAAACIYAVAGSSSAGPWARSAWLTLALLLKPHLALWVLVALLLAPGRSGRTVARQTCLLTAAAIAAIAVWLAVQGELFAQAGSYLHMVTQELAGGGSMNPTSHEILNVTAQITSLRSLVGYWNPAAWLQSLATAMVILLGIALVWLSLSDTESEADAAQPPFALVGAWSGFGLLATYHRAHDGIVLLVLLPWLLARVRTRFWDPASWIVVTCFTLMCVGADLGQLDRMEHDPASHLLAGLSLRQSPLAALVLTLTLLVVIARRHSRREVSRSVPDPLPSQSGYQGSTT